MPPPQKKNPVHPLQLLYSTIQYSTVQYYYYSTQELVLRERLKALYLCFPGKDTELFFILQDRKCKFYIILGQQKLHFLPIIYVGKKSF